MPRFHEPTFEPTLISPNSLNPPLPTRISLSLRSLLRWIPRPQHWIYIGWFGGIQIVSRQIVSRRQEP